MGAEKEHGRRTSSRIRSRTGDPAGRKSIYNERVSDSPRKRTRPEEGAEAPASPGILYLVATPIGNLGDVTLRAREVLARVDGVAAEDRRVTGRLLHELGIEARLLSYHDHNKERVTSRLLDRLEAGESLALVTDAGTPGISDPGFYLVRAAVERGLPVTSVPGPSAPVNALVLSGLPTDTFVFWGYLPRKAGAARREMERMREEERTIVYFDSPHRVRKNLELLAEVLPGARLALCREMTKRFEEVVRGSPAEVLEAFEGREIKGEVVVVLRDSA
jgi:16S rRNA (cytidine1402-2'-O)-methyltransferase